jgi:hypothetical protein
MSMPIDSIDDLKAVLKACKLNIANVDDLQGLLRTINATYNPDAARVKAAKTLAAVVPSFAFVSAVAVSYFVVAWGASAGLIDRFAVGALGIVWGVAGLASVVATVFGGVLLLTRRRASGEPAPAAPRTTLAAPNFNEHAEHVTVPDGR